MKLIRRAVSVAALAAGCLVAQEASDRQAVQRSVEALNLRNWRSATITSDPAALATFQRLLRGKNLTYRIRPGAGQPVVVAGRHGMFGNTPAKVTAPMVELQNPRVVPGAVRFVSEDEATVDASLVEWSGTVRRSTPLLFTMKRDAGVWKIAGLQAPDAR
jgi:hypothetical protein